MTGYTKKTKVDPFILGRDAARLKHELSDYVPEEEKILQFAEEFCRNVIPLSAYYGYCPFHRVMGEGEYCKCPEMQRIVPPETRCYKGRFELTR